MMRTERILSRLAFVCLVALTTTVDLRAEAEVGASRPLRPPTHPMRSAKPAQDSDPAETEVSPLSSAAPDVKTVAASLSLVLGLFLTAAWLLKRSLPKAAGLLPPDVVQVLGRAQLAGKQFVHLVRCGNKLLLVSATPGGSETLTEITEPLEVDRLLGICAQQNPSSATAAFREVFQQLGRERSHA